MSKEELVKELTSELVKKELIQRIAEAIATEKVGKLEQQLKGLPNTIILKEEYQHPSNPQCRGCPHPEGRYKHPQKTMCELEIPEHSPLSHDHKGENLKPNQLHPTYCSLRTVTKLQNASDVDDTAIGDDKLLVYKTGSKKHEYEAQSTYTDADAIAAVEGEATLDLTGILSVDTVDSISSAGITFKDDLIPTAAEMLGQVAKPWAHAHLSDATVYNTLNVDNLLEESTGAGVTVDGVLCKDNVIPDSAYPNAILDDGTRAMTGDFDLATFNLKFDTVEFEEYLTGYVRLVNIGTTTYKHLRVSTFYAVIWQGVSTESTIQTRKINLGRVVMTGWDGSATKQSFGVKSYTTPAVVLPYFIDQGSGPAASSTYRGHLLYTEGAGGVADTLKMCLKSAADTYSWVVIATG